MFSLDFCCNSEHLLRDITNPLQSARRDVPLSAAPAAVAVGGGKPNPSPRDRHQPIQSWEDQGSGWENE